MRARFDANKDEKDTRKSQYLLADGCRQLWEKRHFKPFRCELSFAYVSLDAIVQCAMRACGAFPFRRGYSHYTAHGMIGKFRFPSGDPL